MYRKEQFSPEARAAKMLAAFKRSALECGWIAREADSDIPARNLQEMCQLSVHLQAQLVAMRARHASAFE